MRLKLISCEVFQREFEALLARSQQDVDSEFLPLRMHDRGGKAMSLLIQERINAADAMDYDAIGLGYALCGNGIAGLKAGKTPIVVPRAHDCIAVLMGDRHAFMDYFEAHSGVYYRSPGWLERGRDAAESVFTRQFTLGLEMDLDALLECYGEENGRYVYEQMTSYLRHYRQLTYIRTGVEPDSTLEGQARAEAATKGWSFEVYAGSMRLLECLLSGDWNNEDFLVVQPGKRVRVTGSDAIVEAQ